MSEWKLERQEETEVYVTKSGTIVIRQENGSEDDSMILLSLPQAEAISGYLRQAIDAAKKGFADGTLPESDADPNSYPHPRGQKG